MNRQPIFDAVHTMLGRPFTQADVAALDKAIDLATGSLTAGNTPAPAKPAPKPDIHTAKALGSAGKALIQKWEGCHKLRADGKYDAYPDPGSVDGKVWTRAQCDTRFDTDMAAFSSAVGKILGDAPTTQNQFDALVSFHYNTGALAKATLTTLHKQGNFKGAAAEFAKWIYNDGKPMQGLKNRRAEEAALYSKT